MGLWTGLGWPRIDNRHVVRIFVAPLRFSVDSRSYFVPSTQVSHFGTLENNKLVLQTNKAIHQHAKSIKTQNYVAPTIAKTCDIK